MKILRLVFTWAALSLAMQCAGLFFLDKYYFTNNSNVTSTKVEIETPKKNTEESVFIPKDAENINISYNGKYIAYFQNEDLKVMNTTTGEVETVETTDGSQVSYFIWLNDRNRIVMTEKEKSKKGQILSLSSYDVDKSEKIKIVDLCEVDTKSTVEEIKSSTKTGVNYIRIAHSTNRSSIYRVDINHKVTKVSTQVNNLGNIFVVPRLDRLVYDDVLNRGVYATQPNKKLSFKQGSKTKLLGIDGESIVYVGEVNAEKTISKIYYGTLDQDQSLWKEIALSSPVNSTDVIITNKGQVLINDNVQGKVRDILYNKEYKYEGKFIGIYNSGVATVINDKFYKTEFK